MAQTLAQVRDDLVDVMRDAVDVLPADDVAALVARPDVVRSALAVAARTIVADAGRGNAVETLGDRGAAARVGADAARRRLAARTRTGTAEELLTADEMARRAGLKTRQSVHDWRKKGRIVGWQGAKRGYVFPAGQLDARGQPPEGLDRVVPLFADGYAAWAWLTTPSPALDGKTPLSRLRRGDADIVAAAARGDAQGDFT